MHNEAVEAGITVVNECGVDPGKNPREWGENKFYNNVFLFVGLTTLGT